MLKPGFDAALFDAALTGTASRLVRDDGVEVDLAVRRWRRTAGGEDRWLLDRCTGPAIDLGCGPGRLVVALAAAGTPALGIDLSAHAVALARARGAPALRRDVFGPLPGEGRWAVVLLADGNIGIGGAPRRLLRRMAELAAPGGRLVVEVARGDVDRRGPVRIITPAGVVSRPFHWAALGAPALLREAGAAGWRADEIWDDGGRRFVALSRAGAAAP